MLGLGWYKVFSPAVQKMIPTAMKVFRSLSFRNFKNTFQLLATDLQILPLTMLLSRNLITGANSPGLYRWRNNIFRFRPWIGCRWSCDAFQHWSWKRTDYITAAKEGVEGPERKEEQFFLRTMPVY